MEGPSGYGTTTYDNNDSALQAFLKEWISPRSYADRVANSRDGLGPVLETLAIKLKKGVTVFDDAGVDELLGGSETDWFQFDLSLDKPLDRKISEQAN